MTLCRKLGLSVTLGRSRAVTADLRHRRIRDISIVLTRSGRNILPRKPLTCSLKLLQPSHIIIPSSLRIWSADYAGVVFASDDIHCYDYRDEAGYSGDVKVDA